MDDTKNLFDKLSAPFPAADIEWRAGATNQDKTSALALAYITSRAVMDRLDEVIGPENWKDEYKPAPAGGVLCGLSIRTNGEWVTKWDGADNTDFEAVKGGLSAAFKRAGSKWGIGRYLYKLDASWVACEQKGKTVVLKSIPTLPSWAVPSGNGSKQAPAKMDIRTAEEIKNSKGVRYGDIDTDTLRYMFNSLQKVENKTDEHLQKIDAIPIILKARES